MMVPVGRLTLVRTFGKSELVSAMSFVAIPSLIGPMLGPLVGGFIVAYLHWRVIFFVNIPIGIAYSATFGVTGAYGSVTFSIVSGRIGPSKGQWNAVEM